MPPRDADDLVYLIADAGIFKWTQFARGELI